MKKIQILTAFALIFLLFGACNPEVNTSDNSKSEGTLNIDTIEEYTNDKLDEAFDKAVIVFYALPSPIETARLFKRAGATFDESVLNSVSKVEKYETNMDLAINLGIYSADLSYANLFDQAQITLNYLAASKKMADKLGVLGAINDSLMTVVTSNLDNRDVVMSVISETFMNSNAYLKENQRPEIATMIVFGGWLEGLYISTKLSKGSTTNNEVLVQRIIEQRLSLEDLISLLNVYKANENVTGLQNDVIKIKEIYDKFDETGDEIDPATFNELCKTVDSIRNSYTK